MACCRDETHIENGAVHWMASEMEAWIRQTNDGKRWLARVAAEVGVPLQLALPLSYKEQKGDS